MSGERFIGIDVGGTKVVSAVLEDGTFHTLPPVPTRTDSPTALLEQMLGQIEACGAAQAVCIGLPSIVEWSTGRVRHSVNLPFRDVPLRTLLSERTGIPVYVENDASCAALAEASDGGRIVVENLVMLTIGTGVGGGLVLGGRLYRSATSAAEMGHMMIGLDLADGAPTDPGPFPQPGSLETLAAGRALDRLAIESAREYPKSFLGRRLAKGDDISGHDAVEGAKNGDVHCQHVIRVHGERLGIGIANMINLFDPEEVVIGGGVSLAGDLLLVPAERTARRHTVPGAGADTTIRLARHGPQAGVFGAATVAAQEWGHQQAKAKSEGTPMTTPRTTEAQHIHVVVLHGLMRRIGVVRGARADAGHLAGGDRHAGARAADHHGAVGVARADRVGGGAGRVGVVDRIRRPGAEVDRLVPARLERGQYDRLEREAGVVEGAGDLHACSSLGLRARASAHSWAATVAAPSTPAWGPWRASTPSRGPA